MVEVFCRTALERTVEEVNPKDPILHGLQVHRFLPRVLGFCFPFWPEMLFPECGHIRGCLKGPSTSMISAVLGRCARSVRHGLQASGNAG